MSLTESRAKLALAQGRLLAALAGQADPPRDFDAERVRACAESLLDKRARTAARAWPALERNLGEKPFRARFLAFAHQTLLPDDGSPLSDGYAFARGLAGELDDAARLELLAVELRFRWTRKGLAGRRGPALRLAWLRQARRLIVALRLPWLGVKTLAIPLRRW